MAPEKLAEEPTLAEVVAALHRVADNLDTNNKLRNIALGTAALCLLVGILGVVTALRAIERANDAHDETTIARQALSDQIATNRKVVCSSSRSTAVARYVREPQALDGGKTESADDFIERMLAQKATLLAARGLDCTSIPSFATFPFLQARALYEIEAALHAANPDRFGPPHLRHAPLIPNTHGGPAASDQELENSQSHATGGSHEAHHEGVSDTPPDLPAHHEHSEGRHPPAEEGEEDVPESEAPASPGNAGADEAQPEPSTEPEATPARGAGAVEEVDKGLGEVVEGVGTILEAPGHLGGRDAPLDSAP